MNSISNRRRFLLIAAIAIGVALFLLTLSHASAGSVPVFLIVLPILFIGVLPSPCLMSRVAYMRMGFQPDDPALPTAFQRPPPFLLA